MKHRQFIEQWVNALGLDVQNESKLEQFDDRQYRFSLYLLNQDGAGVKLRKGAINELYVVDDIMDWFHHGYVTVNNPNDVIERAETIYMSDYVEESKKVNIRPYRFRGDGRDLLLLTFEPNLIPETEGAQIPEKLNNMTYTMKFLFTIYATEDVLTDTGKSDKRQKMYFHDYRYQMLLEKNTYYSTAKNTSTKGTKTRKTTNITQASDSDRSKSTGEIIQDILKTSLLESDTNNMFSYHWDFGGTNMLYTSPSNYRAIDDLNYILDRHMASPGYDNQPCLLRLQRFTERWELLPITEYFNRTHKGIMPGAYQTEYFLLAHDSEPENNGIPPERKTLGMDIKTPEINYHFPDISIINDYAFTEMNGSDCQQLLNSVIVHRYDKSSKQFGVDIPEHNIASVRNQFQQLFVNYTFGGIGGHGYTSWLSDTSREKNFNFQVQPSWAGDETSSYIAGRNKTLMSAFLLGNSIEFTSRGETSRRAGVWIAIDRDNNYIDNDYEKKVLGQYFVTRVTHKINPQGEYSNDILGIKPYLYEDLSFDTVDLFAKDTNHTPVG